MITIDQMGTPTGTSEALLTALLALRHRCPECSPISPADLAPSMEEARRRARVDAERAAVIKVARKWITLGWGEPSPRLVQGLAKFGLCIADIDTAEAGQ